MTRGSGCNLTYSSGALVFINSPRRRSLSTIDSFDTMGSRCPRCNIHQVVLAVFLLVLWGQGGGGGVEGLLIQSPTGERRGLPAHTDVYKN